MTAFARCRGVIVPLVTPVTTEATLDEVAAARLVDHVASHGCGMLVLGTTGEVASLSSTIRLRYVDIAVQVAGRRTPVFACIAHNCVAESIEAARQYLNLGADAVVAMLPNYFRLDAVEIEAYFRQLAAAISGPVLLYNMPITTGMSVPVDVVERLSRVSNIAGLKDSENTPGRRELVAERLGGRSDFSLFMGVAAHATAALKLGFVGFVPSSGNLVPQLWHELYSAATAADWPRVDDLQRKADAIGAVFQRNRSLGQSLAALKTGLSTEQLCEPHMMPPLAPLSAAEQERVRRELVAAR